jgi:hypothetical protein
MPSGGGEKQLHWSYVACLWFSIYKELLPPSFEFRDAEPNCAAHHSEMGNLLSLDVSIYQRGTDTKKAAAVVTSTGT